MILNQTNPHDALVMEAARAIGAAQRAVVSAAYGDYAGYYSAAREHFDCARRVSQMEDALNYDDGFRGLNGNIFKKVGKAVSKVVSKATAGVKTAGLVVASASTAVFRPVEKILPKGIVNVGKAVVNTALVPTKLIGGVLTDPKATIKKAPGMIFATPLVSAMKITAEIGKIAPSKTVIGSAARKTEQAGTQLQTYANAHPLQTIGAAAAVAAVAVGGYLAAPYIASAVSSAGASAAATVTAAIPSTTTIGAGIGASAVGYAVKEGKSLIKKGANEVVGGSSPAAAVAASQAQAQADEAAQAAGAPAETFTAATEAILAASGITPAQQQRVPAKSNGGAVIAGAVAGFFVAGPIGAAVGAGAGMLLGQKG